MQNISFRVPSVFVKRANGSPYQTLPSSSMWIARSSTSHKIPGYKKRVHLSPLPYHFDAHQTTLRGSWSAKSGATTVQADDPFLSATVGQPVYDPSPDYSSTYAEALDKLSSAYRGDLDLSIDVAELHQTRKMFDATSRLESLHKLFWSKNGRIAQRYRLTKLLANSWLEFTYGIKPLVGTIFGVADELIRQRLNWSQRYKGRGTEAFVPDRLGLLNAEGYLSWIKNPGELKISTTVGVDMRTDQFDLSRWSSLNPVSIAWELTPYSFVADWVLDVGGYLRNMETYLLAGNKFRSGYRTDLLVGDLKFTHMEPYGAGWTGNILLQGTTRHVHIDRTVLTSYPAPNLPSFKAKLGSSRLLSAASLLAGHLPRR